MPFCAECGSNLGPNPGKFCAECGQLTGFETPSNPRPSSSSNSSVSSKSVLQPQNRTQNTSPTIQPNPKSNEYLPGTLGTGGNIDRNLTNAFGLEQNRPGLQPTMLSQTRNALTVGACRRCGRGIQGNNIRSLNALWHEDCFSCFVCGEVFAKTENKRILEKDGQPWCETCYDKKFGEICGGCGKIIPATASIVKALAQTWHPDCFRCTGCNKIFDSPGVYNKGGKPYCKACVSK